MTVKYNGRLEIPEKCFLESVDYHAKSPYCQQFFQPSIESWFELGITAVMLGFLLASMVLVILIFTRR